MNPRITLLFFALLIPNLCGMANLAAADVDARLSTHEGWVGMPVVLQISINNASDFEPPVIPDIDGCDIRSAGAPSQSSQTTIINGRRTDSRSIVIQYLITPRREGTFEIPPLTLEVDGRKFSTDRLRFVATKSQTGNLLFVEIKGNKDKVFVGQPLELTLKIWLKPFHDPGRNLTLSEGDMWQMISEESSWGSFHDRMKELASNRQRPGGKEVLRDDGQGDERSYYLYEITATVYPRHAGKIDANDVQIVVNYPTELGKARDPFEGFFGGAFGQRSPLSQMMDDDFFSSPFSNRLTVSSSRPIVAEVQVDSTQVLPVPAEGRPADYRGAVGRYKIVTQATPTAVAAGDPITLNIGIAGTGPMELVQAPPLSELTQLTTDFKVADQSLAGFVQDNTKLFSTTIRPRHEGISQIPAIPFSFFDPETEKYETVLSDPIAITVEESESLSMDSIVGRQRKDAPDSPASIPGAVQQGPDFENDHSASVLVPQSPTSPTQWWWSFVFGPPIVWLVTIGVKNRERIMQRVQGIRSAKTRCLSVIDAAQHPSDLVDALVQYIARKTGLKCSTPESAVGVLRMAGATQVGAEVEQFFEGIQTRHFNESTTQSLNDSRRHARELLDQIELALNTVRKSLVRRSGRASSYRPSRSKAIPGQRATVLFLAAMLASSAKLMAAEPPTQESTQPPGVRQIGLLQKELVPLTRLQQETILAEAGDLYSRAAAIASTDSAEANDLFMSAATKYQQLVDSGVQNARLYSNLGNACLQSHQLGRAIANYERAKRLAPNDRQLLRNLEFANSLVSDAAKNTGKEDNAATRTTFKSWSTTLEWLREMNHSLIAIPGLQPVVWIMVISSVTFWSCHIARAFGYRIAAWRISLMPLLLLTTSLTSVVLASTTNMATEDGVIVAKNITLRTGDGETFATVSSLNAAEGQRVQILVTRSGWTLIKTRQGAIGWIPQREVENLSL